MYRKVGRDHKAEAAQHPAEGDVTLTGKVDVQRKSSTVADIGNCPSELSAGRIFTASGAGARPGTQLREGRAITGKAAGWWRRSVIEVKGAVSLG